jgi:hypothetical protein
MFRGGSISHKVGGAAHTNLYVVNLSQGKHHTEAVPPIFSLTEKETEMFAQNDEVTDMDELNREESREKSDIDETSETEPDATLGEDTEVDEDEDEDEN